MCNKKGTWEAVARIADRNASQHFRGHVTSSVMWSFDSPHAIILYWWSFGTKPLFNGLNMTLIRPLKEGQGTSFWYQSISHIRLPIGYRVTFAVGWTVYHSTFYNTFRTERRQTDATLRIAQPFVRSAKKSTIVQELCNLKNNCSRGIFDKLNNVLYRHSL